MSDRRMNMRTFEDTSTLGAWKHLAEHSLKGLFLARAEGIKVGAFSADETDKFIADYSMELMNRYEDMTVDELREEMLIMVLENKLKMLKGVVNDYDNED